jgi:hypothetical protein
MRVKVLYADVLRLRIKVIEAMHAIVARGLGETTT